MSNKTLYVFGDSWPAGSDLDDVVKQGFPYLIAQKNNYTLDNLSQQATSLEHATWQFIKAVERKPITKGDLVLFCITNPDRSWYWKNGYPLEMHPANTNHIISSNYYKYIYSEDLANANAIKNMLMVYAMCQTLGVTCLFVYNWTVPLTKNSTMPGIRLLPTELFYDKSLHEISGADITQGSHPNKLGHQRIADQLSAWIKTMAKAQFRSPSAMNSYAERWDYYDN
jgi:hypothetical protein